MLQITSIETVPVQVPATLYASNGLGNPSADPVSMAFLTGKGYPQTSDWKAGTWTQSQSGQWMAQVLVGPTGGVITLTPGIYYHWIKIVDPASNPMRCIGLLEVT